MKIYEEDLQERIKVFRGIEAEVLIDQLSHIKAKSESIGIRLSDNEAWSTDVLAILYELAATKKFIEIPQPLLQWVDQFNKDRKNEGVATPNIVSIW